MNNGLFYLDHEGDFVLDGNCKKLEQFEDRPEHLNLLISSMFDHGSRIQVTALRIVEPSVPKISWFRRFLNWIRPTKCPHCATGKMQNFHGTGYLACDKCGEIL